MLLVAALFFPATAVAAECTDTWTGPAEGTWSTVANWSAGHVPGEADIACIGSGKTVNMTTGTGSVKGIQGEGTLVLKETTLTLLGTAEASQINNLTIKNKGNLAGAGSLKITKALKWESTGTMSGTGTTILGPSSTNTIGNANINYELVGRKLLNEGATTEAKSAALSLKEGATLENTSTYTITVEDADLVFSDGATSKIINKGTFEDSAGPKVGKISAPFENYGTINTGTHELEFYSFSRSLLLADESHVEGAVSCRNRTVTIEGITVPKATIKLRESEVTIPSGKTASVGTYTMVYQGNLTGAGTLEVTSALNWEGESTMSGAGKTILGSSSNNSLQNVAANETLSERTLINKGTVTQGSSTRLNINADAVFKNQGTYNLNGEPYPTWVHERIVNEGGGNGRFVNSGTFQRTEGSIAAKVVPEFENLSTVKEPASRIEFEHPVVKDPSNKFGCKCKHADPVDGATGDFSETQVDFSIGGRGLGLLLARTYSAQAAAKAGSPDAFGYGWSNAYSDHLTSEEGGKQVTLTQGNGGTVPFTEASKGVYTPAAWSQDTLAGTSESGYTLITPGQTEYAFSGTGRLESVTDRNGNQTTLGYSEAGRLETITDPVGRKITLTYNGEGLVEEAKDPMGHEVKYSYEGKNLKTVTLPGEVNPRWQFKYDTSHRITEMTDGRGGKTKNEYDTSSRVKSQTDPASRTTTFEYAAFHTTVTNKATGAVIDEWFTSNNEPFQITRGFGTASATTETFAYNEEGRLLSRTDGNGHKTTYAYDEDGNRTSETDAAESQTKWTYNGTHDVVSMTTPEGEKTTIERDGQGNPESVMRPAPGEETQTTSFEYGSHGEVEAITDPLERTTSFEYDTKGNLKAAINPEGDKQTWGYNEDSRVTSMVAPRGNEEGAEAAKFTTTIERDAQGRPTEVIDLLEQVTKYAYDPNGNLETLADPKSHKAKYTYNADDELTKVEKPNGDLLETGYDGAGQVTSQIDGNKNTTTYKRNVLELVTEVIDPLERKTALEYDLEGNLKSETDPDERKSSFSYDAADRLKEVSYSDGMTPTAKFTYNKDSQLKTMSDGSGESIYSYDQLGRLIESENGHGNAVGYEYNLANEPIEITYPNGKVVSQAFDAAGRLERISDWLGHHITFAYNPDSGVKSTTFPEGTGNVDEYTYDRTDLLSEVNAKQGAETLASLGYTRDKAGLIEKQVSSGLPGAAELSFEYDANNRLTKAGGSSYEYDAADNLIKAPGTTNVYDKASQLEAGTGATYSFNKEGQRTKLTPASGPATTYKYDQAGNLTAVERAKEGEVPAIAESFAYDGEGLMASHKVGEATSYLTWSAVGSLPLLLSDGQNSYLYGPGGLPVEHISSEEVPSYYHHDQLGSTRMLTNGSGEPTATFTYSPYGVAEGSTGSETTPLGFAGQYTLPQSQLQYLRARTYDPVTGQFLSRDPLESSTRQPYIYVGDSPLNGVDPTGLFFALPIPIPVEAPCLAGPWALAGCAGLAGGTLCAISTTCHDTVSGLADDVGGLVDSLFGGEDTDQLTLNKAEQDYEDEHNECPKEGYDELKKRVVREGEELLGRSHSEAGKRRWHERFDDASPREKKAYKEGGGPRPGKRQG